MALTLDVQRISEKWKRKSAASQQDYADGVANTSADWAGLTTNAAAAYNAGIQASLAARRFESGVAKAGTAKWKSQTIAKGPARWTQGIDLSGDNYIRGFTPYAQVIQGLSLPPRGPRGAAQNYNRSLVLGKALNDKRTKG